MPASRVVRPPPANVSASGSGRGERSLKSTSSGLATAESLSAPRLHTHQPLQLNHRPGAHPVLPGAILRQQLGSRPGAPPFTENPQAAPWGKAQPLPANASFLPDRRKRHRSRT